MAEHDQRILLMRAFIGGREPADAGRRENADGADRLDQRQVTSMAESAAMLGLAAMRVLGCKPSRLRRQDAACDQQDERQFCGVTGHSAHL